MAKLSIGQKAQRMVVFIMGLRHVAIMTALAKRGFSEETLRDGLRLLSEVVRLRLSTVVPKANLSVIAELDAFENEWFPVARHTLLHRYPAVAAQLFANLRQTEGVEAAMSVTMFVERVRAMEAGAHGPDSAAARALLIERGLTEERVAEAEALLAELTTANKATVVATTEAQSAAEQAMWAWYREWSGIARATIKEKRLLRALGFRKASPEEDDTEIDLSPTPNQPPAPSAPQLPASTSNDTSTSSNTSNAA